MAFRLLPEAEAELDDSWLYVARESGSIDIATRLIEGIADRFRFACPASANRTPARC